MEEEKEEEGADSSGSSSSSDEDDGGPAATRFPPDFVGRLLARLHRFAMRDAGGGGSSCGGAWQGGCILGCADNTALLQVRNLGDDGDVLELDVWGVYPVTLRGIVHGAVQPLVQEHYPGIALEVTIPCPCRDKKEVDGADGKPIKCTKGTDGAVFKCEALHAGLARLVKAEAEVAAAQPGGAAVAARRQRWQSVPGATSGTRSACCSLRTRSSGGGTRMHTSPCWDAAVWDAAAWDDAPWGRVRRLMPPLGMMPQPQQQHHHQQQQTALQQQQQRL